MRIMIVTDAWAPQTNGVVNTLAHTAGWLERFGHQVEMLTPESFRTVPCPTYPEIRLSLFPYSQIARRIRELAPDALHIATEGPLGFAARRYCIKHGLSFTSSYHTQFPQYLRSRCPIPLAASYLAMRRFHAAAARCMVSTPTLHSQLTARGFHNLTFWRRGVDAELFRPRAKDWLQLPRPVAAYVGRVAVEKNVAAFLAMPWSGTKLVIGHGPEFARLREQFPKAVYVGYRFGEDLAQHLAAADVLCFPSRTDTFGLVILEALACGVPVAAYPVAGPVDIIEDGVTGALDEDLAKASIRALAMDPPACRTSATRYSWEACTRQFESHLVLCREPAHTPQMHVGLVTRHSR